MKLALLLTGAVLVLGGTGWYLLHKFMPPKEATATLDPQQARIATHFLDALDAGRFNDALALCTDEVRAALSEDKLRKTWQSLPGKLGARSSRGPLHGATIAGRHAAVSTLVFAALPLDARIVFDDDNRISGFRIVPAQGATTVADHVPEKGPNWHEEDLGLGAGASALPATLTLPDGAGPWPAVVLVQGSGPSDRDETIGPNKPFRDLAHGLVQHGIAVLRYVKRSAAHPGEFAGDNFTVDNETVNDAVQAVALLRVRPGIDPQRVFVAGHSLGAMMAPRIATRAPHIAGLILLAAPAVRLEDTYIRQVRLLSRETGMDVAQIGAEVAPLEVQREAVRHLDPASLPKGPMMLGLPARYWLDLNHYDPIATARAISTPLLILQGERDYQVTPQDDFVRWQEAFADNPRVTLIEYPRLSHLFMPAGDPPGPRDYQVPAHVDAKVIDDIAHWIAAH